MPLKNVICLVGIACVWAAGSMEVMAQGAKKVEAELRELLPEPAEDAKKPYLSVEITEGGKIKVNGRVHEKPKALKKIERLGKAKPEEVVVVKASDGAKHEVFVAVVDALARAGVKNVTMVGFREKDEGDPEAGE